MKRVALVLLVAYPFAITWAQPADADTNRFRQWEHDEWRDFVLLNPQIGRDFAQAKLNVLLSEERDVVHVAYALGLAE